MNNGKKKKIIQENLFLKEGDIYEIGNIKYTETNIISFFLDNYKGLRYANIRNFVISKRFSGPTKKGIKLTKEELSEIVCQCKDLNFDLELLEEKIICSIIRTNSKEREIRISITLYNGKYGFDIREMYKGKEESLNFGRGIRIKIEFAEQSIDIMNQMNDKFNIKFETGTVDNINLTNESIIAEPSKDKDKIIINDIPEDLNKYF